MDPAAAGAPALAREIVSGVTRYIALLRGVNRGKDDRIAMADLRELLSGLGYSDVKTLLNSGNAVFTTTKSTKAVEREVTRAIDKKLLPGIAVVMRTRSELAKVIENNPIPKAAKHGSSYLVLFLSDKVDRAAVKDIDPADFAPEEFGFGRREIYCWCPNGIQGCRVLQVPWEKRAGVTMTGRNWNTVTKLLKLADS